MLVGDRMTPTVITTTRAAPITGVLDLLREWRIRTLPLVSLAARLSERGLHVVHAAGTPGLEPAPSLSVACVECDGGLAPADGGG